MDELNHDPELDGDPDESALDPDESSDAGRLTPRVAPAARRRRKNPFALVALVLIVGALGVVVFNGLGDATLFFRTADEAVAQRDELGDRRFRIQGLVDGDTITPTGRGADFVVANNGARVTISLHDNPPDLFQPGIPVVVEGNWVRVGDPDVVAPAEGLPTDDGWFFASDRALVAHTEVYVEENPDRVDDYDQTDDGAPDGDDTDDMGDDGETEASPTR